MEPIKTIEHNGNMIEIHFDEDATSPREDENLGTITYRWDAVRYTLGDEATDVKRMEAIYNNDRDYISLSVYAYMHGGVILNTTGFSCPWDSGQSGIIYVSKEKVRKEWDKKRISAKLKAQIYNVLRAEVQTFSDYLSGDVYGYTIKDKDGEVVDSCWGYYGMDYCEREAVSMVS